MSIKLNGLEYFRTKEALEMTGISRPTFFRWLKEGLITDVKQKDRRGWRLFTKEDVKRLSDFANEIIVIPEQGTLDLD